MARDITAAVEAAIAAGHVRWAILLEGRFDSGDVLLWSGLGALTHDGKTYQGGGELISVGEVRESTDGRVDGVPVTLTGIPSEFLSLALAEDYQGREVEMSLALFDASGSVIADVVPIMIGMADQMTIDEDGETATITLVLENETAVFERRSGRRLTSASQKAEFPQDRGLDHVAGLEAIDIRWGGGSGGGGGAITPIKVDNNPQGSSASGI